MNKHRWQSPRKGRELYEVEWILICSLQLSFIALSLPLLQLICVLCCFRIYIMLILIYKLLLFIYSPCRLSCVCLSYPLFLYYSSLSLSNLFIATTFSVSFTTMGFFSFLTNYFVLATLNLYFKIIWSPNFILQYSNSMKPIHHQLINLYFFRETTSN